MSDDCVRCYYGSVSNCSATRYYGSWSYPNAVTDRGASSELRTDSHELMNSTVVSDSGLLVHNHAAEVHYAQARPKYV